MQNFGLKLIWKESQTPPMCALASKRQTISCLKTPSAFKAMVPVGVGGSISTGSCKSQSDRQSGLGAQTESHDQMTIQHLERSGVMEQYLLLAIVIMELVICSTRNVSLTETTRRWGAINSVKAGSNTS